MARTVPLAAAVNDLSGFGRCSLTVALPVLSAMGIQACPLPTALLSNHTAYDSCFFQDLTASIPPYLAEWKKLGLSFDAIFTGFLGSWQQVSLVEEFVHGFRGEKTLFLADKPEYRRAGAWAARLLFTTEDPQTCVRAAERCLGRGSWAPRDLTRGLYYRDVE